MNARVVIVGGGVVGLCTALFCLRRGMGAVVLEREPAQAEGCSSGNAGLVVPSHFVPLAAPGMVRLGLKLMADPKGAFGFASLADPAALAWAWRFMQHCRSGHVEKAAPILADLNLRSRALYSRLSSELAEPFGYQQKGLMMACQTDETLLHEEALIPRAARLGMHAEKLGPQEARQRLGLELEAAGGVWFEDDGHLDPGAFLQAVRSEIRRLGGEVVSGIEVEGWEMHNGRIAAALTSQGPWPGSQFVAAAGVWTSSLLPGLRLPLMAGLGCSVTLFSPPALPHMPFLLVEARVAVTPMGGSLRFAGTMELGPPRQAPSPGRLAGLKQSVSRALPQFSLADLDGQPAWSGNRPCLPDGLPAIGRHPGLPNLVIAAGHAMLGLSLGPASGEHAAAILAGEPGLRALSPARFS